MVPPPSSKPFAVNYGSSGSSGNLGSKNGQQSSNNPTAPPYGNMNPAQQQQAQMMMMMQQQAQMMNYANQMQQYNQMNRPGGNNNTFGGSLNPYPMGGPVNMIAQPGGPAGGAPSPYFPNSPGGGGASGSMRGMTNDGYYSPSAAGPGLRSSKAGRVSQTNAGSPTSGPTTAPPTSGGIDIPQAPDANRQKLQKVLADKEIFIKSTRKSFEQFDKDKSGTLDFQETKALIKRLCENLLLPPVDDVTLSAIFHQYDVNNSNELDFPAFAQLYWKLLLRVRDKYYPPKIIRVRRSYFIGHHNLQDQGMSIRDVFRFNKKLGRGSFGEAHLVVERSSGLRRVCKMINKEKVFKDCPPQQVETEIAVMKSLDHPNVIKIYEVYEDYMNIYIIMEYCEGGELLDRASAAYEKGNVLAEQYVALIMRQIVSALAYIHTKMVAHKDLKPENILFQDCRPESPLKLIDFGLSELFNTETELSSRAAGTAFYMAPEVYRHKFNTKCDIWSAGCIMYQLLTGQQAFSGDKLEKVKEKILRKEPPYEQTCKHVTALGVDLMKKMLIKDPKTRPSAQQALEHPWFKEAVQMNADVRLNRDICDNLQKYKRQSNLKNALVNLMAHQLNVSGSQINQITEVFKGLDKDNNGTLSRDELATGLAQAGIPKYDINPIVSALDIDGSNNISYTEFLAACYSWRESELNIVWSAFNKLDRDGDGKITVEEFTTVLLGETGSDKAKLMSDREIKAMILQIDQNGDGVIDWDEFLTYLRNNTSR